MRFIMLMIPEVYQGAKGRQMDPDFAPSVEMVEKMMRYNEKLANAGALISLDGFHHPSTGARVSFAGGKAKVTDGPFAESKEVLGGYWIIEAKSKQEAIEWARAAPSLDGDTIEVRQIFDPSDFPEDVQKAAENPTVQEQLKKHREA
jgi:hypothetical protein